MRLPNLLATRKGRLTAFFLLYVTEGIPLGFAATAVATQLRRQGVGPAEIGAFVGSFYLPWAFKWAFGPVIDVFASDRIGRRRGWIIGTQVLMAATLLSTVLLKLPEQLWLFTTVLLVHNSFGAMQDVAIDALAVNTLREDERGFANGMMFGGAYIGQALGGAGVLFLTGYTGFQATFFFVAAAILLVTLLVVLPMREAPGPARAVIAARSRLQAAGLEMKNFAVEAFRSFLGTRGAFGGLLFNLLPAGAMCLGLALQSNLAVELGMNDDQVALINLWSTVLSAGCCVLGGYLSDRLGRRRTLFVYLAGMSLPVLYLMVQLSQFGWIMPVDTTAANRPQAPAALLTAFWIGSLVYAAFQGLMYGTRSAVMMDVTNPAVAATQFTAYMALANLSISYSATWQGVAIEAWGYPRTKLIVALFGLCCQLFGPRLKNEPVQDALRAGAAAALRARATAGVLALLCFAWLPFQAWRELLGGAQPIAGTLFTVVFVGSALFLLAGAAVIGAAARGLARMAVWVAPLLFAMHLRYHVDAIARGLSGVADPAAVKGTLDLVLRVVPVIGGVVLLLFALKPWRELGGSEPAGAAWQPAG
ncbi:MAG TPA: MFS transporter [Albitalea sp.]|nr:MFS transporter [Albitalea sp.]